MKKNESGEMIIEASVVLSLTVVIITALIYLGFTVYQQTNMQIIANETAENVAQVYAAEYKDPIYGYISESEFYKTELYRNLTNIFTGSLDKVNKTKAEWYGLYRLKKTRLIDEKEPEIDVQIESKPGKIMQKQVVVTISCEITNPFAKFWGADLKTIETVEGRADCMDLIDYMNMVDTAAEVYGKIDKGLETFADLISNFEEVFDIVKRQMGASGK